MLLLDRDNKKFHIWISQSKGHTFFLFLINHLLETKGASTEINTN